MRDDLATWLAVRERVAWAAVPAATATVAAPDGVETFVSTVVRRRDPHRAARLRAALQEVRTTAAPPGDLTLERLATWQCSVLGAAAPVPFRRTTAYAKGGRERYGIGPDTERELRRCLAEGSDPAVPLAGRAARVYLDVCFFHPFADGNARAALLALLIRPAQLA